MTDSAASAPRKRRPLLALLTVLLLVGAVAATTIWIVVAFRRPEPPTPPNPDLTGVDSGVRDVLTDARAAVVAAPNEHQTWGDYGVALLIHGLSESAVECLLYAQKLQDEELQWPYFAADAFMGGASPDPESAVEHLQRAVALADAQSAFESKPIDGPRLKLADLHYQLGDNKKAEAEYRTLLKDRPNHPKACLGMGQIRYRESKWPKALAWFNRCKDDLHARKTSWTFIAQIHQRQGDDKRSEQALTTANKLPKDRPWPDALAASVFERFQRSRSQTQQMIDARRARGDKQASRLVKNTVYEELFWLDEGRRFFEAKQYAKAERAFQFALQHDKDIVPAHILLAHSLYLGDKTDKAVTVLKKLVAKENDNARAWLLLGRCHAKLKQTKDATTAFAAAIHWSPLDVNARYYFAKFHADAGNYGEAKRHLRDALVINPNHPAAVQLTAIVQKRLDER